MNTFELIRNAHLLQEGEAAAQEPAVRGLLSKISGLPMRRSIMYAASYFLARNDPISRHFLDEESAPSLDEALKDASQLTRNLNKRFGRAGLVVLNASDPAFLKAMARLPSKYFKGIHVNFEGFTRKVDGLSAKSFSVSLENSLVKLGRLIKHHGVSLDAFIRMGNNDEYNSYARTALSYNVLSQDQPIAYFVQNRSGYGVSILNLCERKGVLASDIPSFPFTPTLTDQKWFYIFSHELGHCLTPISDYKTFEKDILNDKGLGEGWVLECYADTFAACLSAKITGNWDMLRTTILPLRAYAENEHNTFSVLELLLDEDPSILIKADEAHLVDIVDQLTRRNVQAFLDRGDVSHDLIASQVAAGFMNDGPSVYAGEVDPEIYQNLLNRTQRVVDAVAIETSASGVVNDQALSAVSAWLHKMGHEKVGDQIKASARLPTAEAGPYLLSFASKDASLLSDRLTSNEFQLADFVENLKETPTVGVSNDVEVGLHGQIPTESIAPAHY